MSFTPATWRCMGLADKLGGRSPRLIRRAIVRSCATQTQKRKIIQGDLNWAPLHTHTDYSFLDGASHVSDLASRAAELGIPALAITDHGNMHGAIAHLKSCQQAGVKPILGNEMYVINGPIDETGFPGKVHHATVLAKNTTGYRNLVKLTSISHLQGMKVRSRSRRPAINKELLAKHREGLIVLSGCLAGEIPQALWAGQYEIARAVALWYQDVFGEDFYLELMDHGRKGQRLVNPGLVRLGKELGIKTVVSNDSHFTRESDKFAHDALVCIKTGQKVDVPKEQRLHYMGEEWFKSADDMLGSFAGIDRAEVEESLKNTLEVARKVEPYDILGEPRIPKYPLPAEFEGSTEDYFRKRAEEGLRDRLSGKEDLISEYMPRLQFEMDVLIQKGFADYFLIVWDYIRFARESGISVGPGRGSACGSVVAYALNITDIDPVTHNLLFERFLNPERKSLPDIDTDFSMEGREKVIKYVSEKYGENRVAQIVTFSKLSSKAVLRDTARVCGMPYAEADKLAKLVPVMRGKPAKLATMISPKDTPAPEFKKMYDVSDEVKRVVDVALVLEGTNRTSGVHAAGVVIGSEDLDSVVPLMRGKNNEVVTQYAMEDLEAVGLLKMDFLGLKNLDVIDTTIKNIEKKGGESSADVDRIGFEDRKTYDLLASGNVDGVFQLDASDGMQKIVQRLRPTNIEDVSSILALYRPGPLDAGLVESFIKRKHGTERVRYAHPMLEGILKETYGVLVYQEQIMQVARDMGGYSLGEADILRRAMGKKKMDVMEQERQRFVDGAIAKSINKTTATDLFTQMEKFAEYCFNKSHSTAYAYLTYRTACLKSNYPVEFTAAILEHNSENMTKLPRYINDASSQGVEVLAPSVNTSNVRFAPVYEVPPQSRAPPATHGYVGFGLSAVHGIGEAAATAIVGERDANGPFTSIFDFCSRVVSSGGKAFNKRVLESLVIGGAFDELHPKQRQALFNSVPDILNWARKQDAARKKAKQPKENEIDTFVDDMQESWRDVQEFSAIERFLAEKKLIGFSTSGDLHVENEKKVRAAKPLDLVEVTGLPLHLAGSSDPAEDTDDADSKDSAQNAKQAVLPNGATNFFYGIVTDLKLITTKKSRQMAKFVIQDATSECTCIAFPEAFEKMKNIAEVGEAIAVVGKVKRDDEGSTAELQVQNAQKLDDVHVVVVMLHAGSDDDMVSAERSVNELRHWSTPGNTLMPVVYAEFDDGERLVKCGRRSFVRTDDPYQSMQVFTRHGVYAMVCKLSNLDAMVEDPDILDLEAGFYEARPRNRLMTQVQG